MSALVAKQRRAQLVAFLLREAAGAPYTTTQIVDVSGIYNGLQGRWDKCHADLCRLKGLGAVQASGSPARWEALS